MAVENTLNVFWEAPLETLVGKEIADKIMKIVGKYCKKHKMRVSDVAVGPVRGEMVVTCVLRDINDTEEISQGIYFAYSYYIDRPKKSNFEFILVEEIVPGFCYRNPEEDGFIDLEKGEIFRLSF